MPSQVNEPEADLINMAAWNVTDERLNSGKFGSTTSAQRNHPVEKGEAHLLEVLLNRRNITNEYEAAIDTLSADQRDLLRVQQSSDLVVRVLCNPTGGVAIDDPTLNELLDWCDFGPSGFRRNIFLYLAARRALGPDEQCVNQGVLLEPYKTMIKGKHSVPLPKLRPPKRGAPGGGSAAAASKVARSAGM